MTNAHAVRVREAFLASFDDPAEAERILKAACEQSAEVIHTREFTQLGNRQTPVTVAELRDLLKCEKVDARHDECAALAAVKLGTASEEQYLEVYPPRAKADLPIRRGRIGDVVSAYRAAGRLAEWAVIAQEAYAYRWDIIFVTLVAAVSFLVDDWWPTAHSLGLLPADLAEYLNRAKALSVLVKTRQTVLSRTVWAEPQVLGGYRQPPMPGFSLAEEARVVAEDGGREIGAGLYDFAEQAKESIKMQNVDGVYVRFRDFIASGEWVTSGASSVGRVNAVIDGEPVRFKARKNMVRELFTDDELYDLAMGTWQQKNVAIVKSELGKIRLAVAGDLGTYLMSAWIDKLMGSAYKQWEGSTIGESLEEQSDRLVRMLKALAMLYGIPYDFDKFDRQPTTEQLVVLANLFLVCAHAVVPGREEEELEFRAIAARLVAGFRDGTLSWSENGLKGIFRVLGGLMSGHGWTSKIGNAWNTTVTAMVRRAARDLGVPEAVIDQWIRGDDTALTSRNWSAAAIVVECYRWLGAKGGAGKFSIWRGACEFLRQWMSDRVEGYGIRSLPGWFQRKPWGTEPWQVAGLIRSVADVRDTLVRRGFDARRVWQLWAATRDKWCRLTRTSRRWLQLPVSLGGLGLEPWLGWRASNPYREPKLPTITVTNGNGHELALVRAQCAAIGGGDEQEMVRVADERIMRRALSDNIQQVIKCLRRPSQETRWRHQPVEAPFADANHAVEIRAEVGAVEMYCEFDQQWYGYGRAAMSDWQLWVELERATGKRPIDLLRRDYSHIAAVLARIEGVGLRRRAALDWLFGAVSFPNAGVNPIVGRVLNAAARRTMGRPKRAWGRDWGAVVYVYGVHGSKRVESSEWYKTLFRW